MTDLSEKLPLINSSVEINKKHGLSVFFATLCFIDVFGVFPLITLPRAIIRCGWVGLPWIFAVIAMQIYTAHLLGRCWTWAETKDPIGTSSRERYPYAALARATLGPTFAKFVAVLVDITVFTAGVPNIIVASQNLQIFGLKITQYEFNFPFCYWMLILGAILCPLMWLGSPKDMKAICTSSCVTVVAASILIWFCIIRDGNIEPVVPLVQPEEPESLWKSIISAYGLILFQFDIHPVLLTIQVDMKDRSKITHAVFYAFIFTVFLFAVTTILAVNYYGTEIRYNLLQMLPGSAMLYVTLLLITSQLCFTSAVCNSTLYQDVEDYLKIPRNFNYKRCCIRTIILTFAILLGESVPRFDIVMDIIGGTFTGPLVFILPTIFYMKILWMESRNPRNNRMNNGEIKYSNNGINIDFKINRLRNIDISKKIKKIFQYIVPSSILLFGIFATIITTYYSISNAITYVSFSPPCICNVTVASWRVYTK